MENEQNTEQTLTIRRKSCNSSKLFGDMTSKEKKLAVVSSKSMTAMELKKLKEKKRDNSPKIQVSAVDLDKNANQKRGKTIVRSMDKSLNNSYISSRTPRTREINLKLFKKKK